MPDDGVAPMVTVVVLAHDRFEYLPTAIESVRSQSLRGDLVELIVVMNKPDPALEPVFKSSGAFVVNDAPTNLGAKISVGVRLAKAELVAFLEDDDRFERDKLEVVVRLFGSDPSLDFVHNGHRLIDVDGQELGRRRAGRAGRDAGQSAGAISITARRDNLSSHRLAVLRPENNNSSVTVRRGAVLPILDALQAVNGVADGFLYFGMLARGRSLQVTPQVLTNVRLHGQNASDYSALPKLEALRRLAEFSQANRDGVREILDATRQSPLRSVRRMGESFYLLQEVLLMLRTRESSRSKAGRSAVVLAARLREHVVQSRWQVVLLAAIMAVSPGLARIVYRGLKVGLN